CGRCQEVFDAAKSLEEVQTAAAPMPGQEAAAESVHVATVSTLVSGPISEALPEPEPEPEHQAGYELPVPPEDVDEAWLDQPAVTAGQQARADSIAQRMHSVIEPKETFFSEEPAASPSLQGTQEVPATDWATPLSESCAQPQQPADLEFDEVNVSQEEPEHGAQEDAGAPIPSFVRQAQRKAWWSQPAVRFVMGMLVIFLPLTLLLQIAMHERNTLVAWKPEWRTAFENMCVALRCELAPRKSIASVVLTGSSFNQDTQPYHYRLGLSIQNQAPTLVAMPAVELTLTDAQDQVLVRKVFNPDEIGAPAELAARSEWNGSLPVMTQGLHLQVSGYRVMAFYP
ncbi:MAG: DUF3426 domain-containing protein, partial [Comamonas sp.]